MAGTKVVLFLLLAVVAVAVADKYGGLEKICKGVTCPSTYMPGNYLKGNPSNPCGYCQCVWGRPVVRHCAKYLGWSEMYKQCIPMVGC